MINLFEHQKKAVDKLKSGSILVGGVGSGKSRAALAYYFIKECEGAIYPEYTPMKNPKKLFIITTARKRDTLEWAHECIPFLISDVVVDSWNNIHKYTNVKDAFFIFDEQRVVGTGVWVKSFLKITKMNSWILLSATPGDKWIDYIPVFIANGFYKNRTEFYRRHVVFNNFSKYPKIDHYVEVTTLIRFRDSIIVKMRHKKHTIAHDNLVLVDYDKDLFNTVMKDRWNPYLMKPIKDVTQLYYLMRRVVNSDQSRINAVSTLIKQHSKTIIFYNFNYELELLLELGKELDVTTAQWNGHKHELIPKTSSWIYLVQYAAGAEGWNCVETDTIIFYSQNYSFKATVQAAGRIDRINTSFTDLYYYYLRSNSWIDNAIFQALKTKRNFNESTSEFNDGRYEEKLKAT